MFGLVSEKKYSELESKISKIQAQINQKGAQLTNFNSFMRELGFKNYSDDEYIDNPISEVPELAGILNYIGRAYVSGKFGVKRDEDIIENRYSKLFKKPNAVATHRVFRMNLSEYLAAYGYCFVYAYSPSIVNQTKTLTLLDPNKCTIKTKVKKYSGSVELTELSDLIERVEYDNDSGKKTIYEDIDSLILFTNDTNYSIDNYTLTFQSPLDSLRNALEVTPALYEIMTALANEGGVQGFISNRQTDDVGTVPLTPEERALLEKEFESYGLKKGQRRLRISPANVDYVEVSAKVKDLALDVQKRIIKETIADVLGFDAILLNSTEGKKYDNYKLARQSFFTELIMPLASVIDETLTNYFFARYYPSERFYTDYSHLDIFSKTESEKTASTLTESKYIIELNKEVAAGNISRDAAIHFLIINEYPEEDANILIQ
jgi:hypothetical protein